jgi:asparagine synthase (glutamine-hydrolysing)
MPGVVGIVADRITGQHRVALEAMVKCMEHEASYVSGTYVNEGMGVGLGWTSHKGSFCESSPAWNEEGDVCLLFTGEHFGKHQNVMAELRSRGHQCEAPTASYLVHLYEEQGLRPFLLGLNGWFSGMLLDFRDSSAILFNDRYGLKRVYYHERPDILYFASEAKSLLRVLPELRRLDTRSVGEFFAIGSTLQNRSLFSGVSLLPGGSQWSCLRGRVVKKAAYFSADMWEGQQILSGDEYYEKLKATVATVIPRYFDGEARVGVSLTGGVDSRLVMAWARCAPGSLTCYTFGGCYRESIDVGVAREVARLCGQPHDVIPIGNEFLAGFPSLAEKTVYLTDGAMDVSGSPDLFANRIARGIAPVRLTGNYGGEILRGVVAFKPLPIDERLFEPSLASSIRAAVETYKTEMQPRTLSFVAFKQVPWHHYARLCLEESQLTLRSPYLDNDLVSVVFQAPPELLKSNDLFFRLIADGNPILSTIGTDRGVRFRSLPVLREVRRLYQELLFKAEYAYDYGMPNPLVKFDRAMAPLRLERLFLGRHKFYHFRIWYRDTLGGYVREVLLDPRTRSRPYLEGRRIEDMVRSHIGGLENHTYPIHRLLSSELIQRQLIERDW